jgi:SAM-dependent methyltransferase
LFGLSDRHRLLANAKTRVLRAKGLGEIFLTRRGWRRIRYTLLPPSHGVLDQRPPVSARTYRTYEEYVRHQASKLDLVQLDDYEKRLKEELADRFRSVPLRGRSVLCLGARLGAEVRAFRDLGAFAVGVDLNPGERNELVLLGDFHQLVFPDACTDVVYTNSMDHALDLSRMLQEVQRVLRPGGTLLVDAQSGAGEAPFDDWAATSWRSIDDLAKVVLDGGFELRERSWISTPWRGEFLRFSS